MWRWRARLELRRVQVGPALTVARPRNATVMRSGPLVTSLAIVTLTLSACATPTSTPTPTPPDTDYAYRGGCGSPGQDEAGWSYVKSHPAESDTLRALSDANPVIHAGSRDFAVESWFVARSGDLMLCRTEQSPSRSCVTQWWAFRKADGEWRVIDKGALICVA